MATKILDQADLDKLIGDIDQLPREELERLAQLELEKRAKDIERRKNYNAKKTPEQIEKHREYQKKNNALKRARSEAIIAKAKEMGIIKDSNE